MSRLTLSILVLLALTGCGIHNDTNVIVNKQELKDLMYQWGMYREVAIVLYAQKHKVSREAAEKHLKENIDDAKETYKQFYDFVAETEYENKWGNSNGKDER